MKKYDTKRENIVFCLILAVSFLMVLLLNFLTPFLSDDYRYLIEVEQAHSFRDLILQEAHQYQDWNGRSVVHLLLRIFLFLPRPVFRVANSLAFTAAAVLMVRLAVPGRKNDVLALLLAELYLWLFSVDFSETVLWMDGACNYLWGTIIILFFMYRMQRRSEYPLSGGRNASACVLLFLMGVIAGWCNENTSGGCLLFCLYLIIAGAHRRRSVPAPLVAGTVGNAAGLAIMVLSPGENRRADMGTAEQYSGILRYLARLQKITLSIRDTCGILLAVLAVCLVILLLQRNRRTWNRVILFTLLFLATSYALVLARPTQVRAFFGAEVFLGIALMMAVRGMVTWEREHRGSGSGFMLRAGCYGGIGVLLLFLFFHYVDDSVMTARIWRDEQNRIALIQEKAAAGETEIYVFKIHEDFYNDFSAMGRMDMDENASYWINGFYESYYGVDNIHALPYDTWAQEYQDAAE